MNIGFANYQMDWAVVQRLGQTAAIIAAILLITWVLAKAAKWAFAKLVDRVPMLQRQSGSGESVGESLGKIVSLLIWLLGMIAVLQQLGLNNVIQPLQTLLDQVMGFGDNILGAGVILFVGIVVARIVRQLIETTLTTVNLDGLAARGGVDKVTGTNTISKTIATVCYVLIIIPIAIAALQALEISAISDPATQMLQTILNAIPLVIGAVLLLGIGYFAGDWVSGLLEDLLNGLGFDRTIHSTGLLSTKVSPSKVAGSLAMIGIMLFLSIAATRMLDFPELTAILNTVLEVGSRVIFGSVIIAVGILIANLIAGIVANATDGGSLGPNVIRYATIGLFVAMGLSQMGIGGPIVQTAFTAIVIAAAAAGALAFGLGGRDAAARVLDRAGEQADSPAPKTSRKN
jgi:Conserved TM helix